MSNQQQRFATPQDALAHYGVKGMKWGVRRTDAQLARASSYRPKEKLTTGQIMESRRRHAARVSKIYEADREVALATTAKGKAQALKTVEKYAKEIATSEDARIGARWTKSERRNNIIFGTIIAPGAGTVAAVALNAGNRYKTRRRD